VGNGKFIFLIVPATLSCLRPIGRALSLLGITQTWPLAITNKSNSADLERIERQVLRGLGDDNPDSMTCPTVIGGFNPRWVYA